MPLSPRALFSNDAVYTDDEMPLADAWVVLPPDAIEEPEPHEPSDAYYTPGLHRIVACSAGTPPEELVRTQDSQGYDVDTPPEWLQLPEETAPFRAYSPAESGEGEMGLTFGRHPEALPRLRPHRQDSSFLEIQMATTQALGIEVTLTLSTTALGEAYGRPLYPYRLRWSYPAAGAAVNLSAFSEEALGRQLRSVSRILRTFRKAGLTCTVDPGFWGLQDWGAIPLRGVAGDLPLIERYSRGLA